MLTRKRYLSAATVLLVAALAACSPTPESSESPGPVGPVPDGLGEFYSQQLDWGDCESYATSAATTQAFAADGIECARLTVPLDYSAPEGTTITIGVLRSRASAEDRRIGSAMINPGGPGASGMAQAARMAQGSWNERLARRFDLVGFDPRGVGASQPSVDCLTATELDAERADINEYDGSKAGVASTEKEARQYGRKCVQRTEHGKKMLANVGTRDVVRDMDVLRSVLGDRKLTYVGYSYGTRIGYTYAETFPHNVRALLLDGAIDPQQDTIESLVAQYQGFAGAFDKFSQWCTGRKNCPLGSDAARATQAYQDLTRPLLEQPLKLADGRVLSYEDATTGTITALYSRQYWPTLSQALTDLASGQGRTLMALADSYHGRGPNGRYSNIQEAFTAINCVDKPPVRDRQRYERAQQRILESADFLDPGLPPSSARDACAFWPVEPTSKPHLPDVDGMPPPLVVSSTHDPATPYEAGVNLAKAMDGGLLTFEGAQHGAFLQRDNACVDQAGTEYLIHGTLPPEGTRCSAS